MISIFLSTVEMLERFGAFAASQSFNGNCFLKASSN